MNKQKRNSYREVFVQVLLGKFARKCLHSFPNPDPPLPKKGRLKKKMLPQSSSP